MGKICKMITQPFFSIITPVYNSEKYLNECIESVINQSFMSWELILIDDGSTDESGSICDDYKHDSRVVVVHQDNQGAFKAKIRGMSIATGQYILGLDSDDFLDDCCLKSIKDTIDKTDCDMISFSLRYIEAGEGTTSPLLTPCQVYPREKLIEAILRDMNHSLCNKAFRREILDQVDYKGLESRDRILNDDYAICVAAVSNIKSGYVIPDCLYNYRIYEESSSRRMYTVEYILDTGLVTEYAFGILKNCKMDNDEITRALYSSFLRMISSRIMYLFSNDGITSKQCQQIHDDSSYIKSEKYESIRILRRSEYLSLFLFRHKMYGALRLVSKILSYKV